MKRFFIRVALTTLAVGLFIPAAFSLWFTPLGAQVAGFPITIGTTVISAASTVLTLAGLQGVSTSDVTDPIIDYSCAGVATTTTGTISSGTRSLTVASAAGWTTGMGIAIANAGSGGTTELITTVTGISGTTFTLNPGGAAASATATGQVVNHDDTACLTAALASGKNIHLRHGTYNVTSELDTVAPIIITGEGNAFPTNSYNSAYQNTGNQTVIQTRMATGTTLKIQNSFVELRHLAIVQASGVTATSGTAIDIENATKVITGMKVIDVAVYNTFNCLAIGGGGTGGGTSFTIENSYFFTKNATTFGCVVINSPTPFGDMRFRGNEVRCPTGPCMYVVASDISSFTDNKFNDCNPCLSIASSSASVSGISFVNNSFEGGTNTGALIQISGTAVDGVTFIGGECGVDNGHGCFTIAGAASTTINSVMFSALSGTPITNTSSGTKCTLGNLSVAGSGAVTNSC